MRRRRGIRKSNLWKGFPNFISLHFWKVYFQSWIVCGTLATVGSAGGERRLHKQQATSWQASHLNMGSARCSNYTKIPTQVYVEWILDVSVLLPWMHRTGSIPLPLSRRRRKMHLICLYLRHKPPRLGFQVFSVLEWKWHLFLVNWIEVGQSLLLEDKVKWFQVVPPSQRVEVWLEWISRLGSFDSWCRDSSQYITRDGFDPCWLLYLPLHLCVVVCFCVVGAL